MRCSAAATRLTHTHRQAGIDDNLEQPRLLTFLCGDSAATSCSIWPPQTIPKSKIQSDGVVLQADGRAASLFHNNDDNNSTPHPSVGVFAFPGLLTLADTCGRRGDHKEKYRARPKKKLCWRAAAGKKGERVVINEKGR